MEDSVRREKIVVSMSERILTLTREVKVPQVQASRVLILRRGVSGVPITQSSRILTLNREIRPVAVAIKRSRSPPVAYQNPDDSTQRSSASQAIKNPSNPLSIKLGLLVDHTPKPGVRKWGSAAVTEKTIRTTKEIVSLGQPTAGAQLSLYTAFCRWRSNHIAPSTPIGQTLAIFGGYLTEAQLKASTAANYVRQLETLCRREPPTGISPEWSVARDCIKGLDLRATQEQRDHAIDISQERAIEIINTIRDHRVAYTIWAMCMCGGRAGDLLRLDRDGFTILGEFVHVHFKVTKAARRQNEQYSIDLPIWYPLPARLLSYSRKEKPFDSDADRINSVLHKAGFAETSYSFRRLFVNGIIERLTENGITNWMKVIELTGHETPKVVKSLYKDQSVALLPTGPQRIKSSERVLTLRRT